MEVGGRGRGGCRGRGPSGGGRGYGRQPNTDHYKLYCTHCRRYHHTRETCWDLNGKPHYISATPAKAEHTTDTKEQETSNKHWKEELSVL